MDESMVTERESSPTKKRFSLPSTFILIRLLSGITMGRTVKLCVAMGVITKFSESGVIMGPLQLSEYPVDPVGVAMIKPSAQYEFRN